MSTRNILGFLLLQLVAAVSGYTSVYYIDNYCGRSITVSTAVRLKLRSYSWPISRMCTVTFRSSSLYHTDSNTRMLVKFNDINLSKGILSCTKSEVDIYDSDNSQLNTGGSCGYSLPFFQPWKTTGNSMTIALNRKSSFTLSGSFDILITQFTTGICDLNEFDCFNGRCVDNSLTCDGYNNCGDNTDETSNCGWGVGVTAGASVGGLVVFVFFVFVFAAVYRRRTYGRVFWASSSAACPPPTHCPPPKHCPPPSTGYCNEGYGGFH